MFRKLGMFGMLAIPAAIAGALWGAGCAREVRVPGPTVTVTATATVVATQTVAVTPSPPPSVAAAKASATSTSEPKVAERNKPTDDDSDPDLQMLSWKLVPGVMGRQVTGKLRNNSSRDYHNIALKFTLYDKDDNVVGTAISYSNVYVPKVPHGKIWFFETASISGESEGKAVRAEFASAKED